jgi:hypothetical protein
MAEIQKANSQGNPPSKADKYSLKTAVSAYKALPIGLRRIVKLAAFCFAVIVVIGVFHPSLAERWKFGTDMTVNLLIALVVAIQAYIYVGQWDVMERSLRSAKQSTIDANRAYVVAKIKDLGPSDEVIQFGLTVENGGNTPANNVTVHHAAAFREEPPWKMLSMADLTEQLLFETVFDDTDRLGVLAPNGGSQIVTTNRVEFPMLGSPEYDGWESGGNKVYCWGTIEYTDIFTHPRQTYFCFEMSVKYREGYPSVHGNKAL